ncbi:hypothetical protein ACVWU4_000995 [Campylobacter coli]
MFGVYGKIKEENIIENITPHEEYFAIDLPKIFSLPATNFLRMITDKSTTTIDNPGLLVDLFLSNSSKLIDKFNTAISSLGIGAAVISGFSLPAIAISAGAGLYDLATSSKALKSLKKGDNVWYHLVLKYNQVDFELLHVYKKQFEYSKKILNFVIGEHGECRPIKERPLKAGEKSELKLFKPDKIGQDFTKAYKHMLSKTKNREDSEEWDNLYKEVMNFYGKIARKLENNIHEKSGDFTDDYRNT